MRDIRIGLNASATNGRVIDGSGKPGEVNRSIVSSRFRNGGLAATLQSNVSFSGGTDHKSRGSGKAHARLSQGRRPSFTGRNFRDAHEAAQSLGPYGKIVAGLTRCGVFVPLPYV